MEKKLWDNVQLEKKIVEEWVVKVIWMTRMNGEVKWIGWCGSLVKPSMECSRSVVDRRTECMQEVGGRTVESGKEIVGATIAGVAVLGDLG